MNIFVTNSSPYEAAMDLSGSIKHHNKMITESMQMLGTAIRLHAGFEGFLNHPKKGMIIYPYVLPGEAGTKLDVPLVAYANHPCTKWVRESISNFEWLFDYSTILCDLYHDCRGKEHGSRKYLDGMLPFIDSLPDGPLTQFAEAFGAWSAPTESMGGRKVSTSDRYIGYLIEVKQRLMHCELTCTFDF